MNGRPDPRRARRCLLLAAALCTGSAFAEKPRLVPLQQLEILDGALFEQGDAMVENGNIFIQSQASREEEAAGDQVLELTDGSQLHGKLLALGKGEILWQRTDAKDPLTFAPQDIRRIVLSKQASPENKKANATVKLQGSDWLAGELLEMRQGKFQMRLGEGAPLEIARERAEWLVLTPAGTPPPDAYDGPVGPLGLAGWDAAADINGSWEYADGALVAKNASPIARQFGVLPEKVDLQFTAGDGGNANRGLTLWLQPGTNTRGYAKGSCYLRFQAGNVSANFYDGEQMKNFTANVDDARDDKKVTRYRLLYDRKDGRLIINLNGKQIADWDLPPVKDPAVSGTFSWQPSYWSSNLAWTISNVRVQPWDGDVNPDGKDDDKGKDLLQAGSAPRKTGELQEITGDAVKFSGTEIARKDAVFLRLASPNNAEPVVNGVARIWMGARGEFDVTGIGYRDGVLKVRTAFAGDLALPGSAVRAIEFPHKPVIFAPAAQAEGGDTLIFKNGDQLRGTLISASHAEPLRWKPVKGDKPVDFTPDRLAGVLLGSRKDAPVPANGAAVYFHNGDWLSGRVLGLDKEALHLGSGVAGDLRIDRAAVRTLYFSPTASDGSPKETPVWDGASQRELWMKGASVPGYWNGENAKRPAKISPWRYLDGAFTLLAPANRNGNGPNLGRIFDTLPEKVEVSFELSAAKGGASYAIQLFFDENKAGLMVQGSWDNAYMYDMSPRKNANFGNQPQQVDFSGKVGTDNTRRHFRFLADRGNGRLWMFVNGRFVGELNRRSGADNAKTGRGIAIMAQPLNSRVTISNLWVAPWSGTLPQEVANFEKDPKNREPQQRARPGVFLLQGNGAVDDAPLAKEEAPEGALPKEPAAGPATPTTPAAPPAPPMDAVAFVNGDETEGIVQNASSEEMRLQCEAGDLKVPLKRTVMIEFGAKPPAPKPGVRLRLVGKGCVTVQSFHIEEGRVVCQSASLGEISFPVTALAEVVFQPNGIRPFETLSSKESAGNPEDDEWSNYSGRTHTVIPVGEIQGGAVIRVR